MTDDTPQNAKVRLKKSETLEVRIPFETKQAFLTACREDGTTASEVVRGKISDYLDERVRPTPQPERSNVVSFVNKLPPSVRRYGPRAAASAVAAVAFATFTALPSAAAPDFASRFKKMDLNGDGVITYEEFLNKTGATTSSDNDFTVTTRVTRSGKDGNAPAAPAPKTPHTLSAAPEIKRDSFAFWLPEELTGGKEAQPQEYTFATHSDVRIKKSDSDSFNTDVAPITITMDDVRKREFEGFDTDKDGKVSFAEYQARQITLLKRGFEILDGNSDSFLTQAEFDRIGMPAMPKIENFGDTGRQIQVFTTGSKYSSDQLVAAFTRLDANKDSKLSLQEYMPPA